MKNLHGKNLLSDLYLSVPGAQHRTPAVNGSLPFRITSIPPTRNCNGLDMVHERCSDYHWIRLTFQKLSTVHFRLIMRWNHRSLESQFKAAKEVFVWIEKIIPKTRFPKLLNTCMLQTTTCQAKSIVCRVALNASSRNVPCWSLSRFGKFI